MNIPGLFNVLRSLVDAAESAAGHETLQKQYLAHAIDAAIPHLAGPISRITYSSSPAAALSALRNAMREYIQAVVADDRGWAYVDWPKAAEALITDMQDNGYYVTPPTSNISHATPGVVTALTTNGQHYAETILLTRELNVIGFPSVPWTSPQWPAGSGLNTTLPEPLRPSFDLSTGISIGDTGWSVTDTELQTVELVGATAGTFRLLWTYGDTVYATTALPYNTSATAMQSALRVLPGLGNAVVTRIDIAAYEIDLVDVPPAELFGSQNETDGTVLHARTRHPHPLAFLGSGLLLSGNAELLYPVSASAGYWLLSIWANGTGSATGTITISLINGVQGPAIRTLSLPVSSITSLTHFYNVWRLRTTDLHTHPQYYIRIHSQDLSEPVLLDDLIWQPVRPLYTGGPVISLVRSQYAFTGDTITVTNNHAGKLYRGCWRLAELDLPTTGNTLIPDEV